MKTLLLTGFFLIASVVFVSCSRNADDEDSNGGLFTLSKAGGGSVSAKLINTSLPIQKNTFTVEYQGDNNSSGSWQRYYFIVYLDGDNMVELDFSTYGPIVLGRSYSGPDISISGSVFNEEMGSGRTEVTFTSADYPSKVSASFKKYSQPTGGTVKYSGNFNINLK